jgi:hypothetical protein
LVNIAKYRIADKIRKLALGGTAIDRQSGRVEMGVQTSGDDVDFAGREALQRFSGPRPVSATLGRVKDAFRYGRNVRERHCVEYL